MGRTFGGTECDARLLLLLVQKGGLHQENKIAPVREPYGGFWSSLITAVPASWTGCGVHRKSHVNIRRPQLVGSL